jgi:ATP-dependent DNA helicase RecG
MVPTEILAEQHFKSFINIFKTIGIPVGLQTGSTKLKNMQDYSIIIGTHALISKGLSFQNIGLAIVDEQHRFGVEQRAALKSKGINSHMLTMTATPIPRTVLLTLYGELDLSVLDEMPSGRIPVKTYLVPQEKRQSGYQWIQKKIQNEHIQTFIICPLIEVSESETMRSIKAAKHEFEHLKHIFPNLRLALLHGRMKAKDKNKIMNEFKNKKYDILVTTPVVEVGIDIPNATIILIEAAERFGLAQLHQLRGRVGRGKVQSYCFLLTEKTDKYILDRLQFFSKTKIGIKLSEYDLKKRGPGDLYGTKQHGYIDLKIASFHDIKLIEQARNAAGYFLHHYTDFKGYPELKKRINKIKNKDIIKN